MSGWSDFAVVTGAATAALLGLLFVAVSIRVETIAKSAELRNRSAQTLTLLLTGLLFAVLLAVPDQSNGALGVEYLALALVVIAVALILDRRAGGHSGTAIAPHARLSPVGGHLARTYVRGRWHRGPLTTHRGLHGPCRAVRRGGGSVL